jgi:hemoglobin-like flavoprotein
MSSRTYSSSDLDDVDDVDDDDVEGSGMELTTRRRHVIKTSWRAVQLGIDVKVTEVFYGRLFAVHPDVRPLFPADDNDDYGMKKLYQKLYATVSLVVDGIDDLDGLAPTLQDLGRRHGKWGVIRAHYEAVVECFLWTLQNYILSHMPNNNAINWVRDVSDAWEWALRHIGEMMADAADLAEEEAARIRDDQEAFDYCHKTMIDEGQR